MNKPSSVERQSIPDEKKNEIFKEDVIKNVSNVMCVPSYLLEHLTLRELILNSADRNLPFLSVFFSDKIVHKLGNWQLYLQTLV